jgi:hypothetical protein
VDCCLHTEHATLEALLSKRLAESTATCTTAYNVQSKSDAACAGRSIIAAKAFACEKSKCK